MDGVKRTSWRVEGWRRKATLRGLSHCFRPAFRVARLVMTLLIFGPGSVLAQAAGDGSLRLEPIALATAEPSYLEFSAGAYDLVADHNGQHQTFGADAEFHFGQKLFFIGPAVGVIADARGGGMVYAGFYSDIAFGPVVVTPLGGIGAWWHGSHADENLGGTFEFRLSLAAAYEFADRSRLGLRLGHISSAGINKRNPGENDLMLSYGVPLQL
jgi:lipid A 3-O-deacylase